MPGRARATDPDTSHVAAARVGTLSLKAKYLMAIYQRGPLSTTEIAHHWNIPRDSMSPRTPDLVDKGLVYCIGRRPCLNPSGRVIEMNAYDLTTKGRGAVLLSYMKAEQRRLDANTAP